MTTEEPTDLEEEHRLVQQLKVGDMNAADSFVRKYRSILRGVIARVLDNDCDIDEVLNDSLLQILKTIATFDPTSGRLLGWSIVISRRRALDRVRRIRSYRGATDRYELEYGEGERHARVPKWRDTCNASDDVGARHERVLEHLYSALITDDQRECLIRHWLRGMSQRDIAEELSAPLGTVKTRLELGFAVLQSLALADPVLTFE
jgi:RNA polymerase sigma-70 factor (ECF subfamily)